MFRTACIAILISSGIAMNAQDPPYKNPKLPVEQRVADLLQRMTIEEKVAQLSCVMDTDLLPGAQKISEKGKFSPERAQTVLKNGIGEVTFLGSPAGPRQSAELRGAMQKWLIGNTRLGIPALVHDEALHGYAAAGGNSYPQAIALGSTWDPALLTQIFTAVAKEARSRGTQQVLAPVLDLGRDPRYGRIEEMYGEDPYHAGRMGAAAIHGLQGNGPGYDSEHVISTAKHFVHGQPEGGTNVAPSNYSMRVLREELMYPFEVAVTQAKIGAVMPSYNEIDGVPSHVNRWLLQQVLRKEWGFQGITVSDYFATNQLESLHHVVADPAGAAARALVAGLDVELPMPYAFPAIVKLVENGTVPVSVVDGAVGRVLRMKFLAGLFEGPYSDPDLAEKLAASAETRALALRAAEEAMVLLKNDNGVLPLDRAKIQTLAVIGPNANRQRLGTYSGMPPYFVTVLDGVKKLVGDGIKVVYAEGCGITKTDSGVPMMNFINPSVQLPDPAEDRKKIAEAVAAAQAADTVVLVLGGNESVSREAIGAGVFPLPHYGDADSLELPGLQNELAAEILKLGKPTAVVLLNGRPYSIPFLAAKAPAILEGWYLGQETGNAVARVLFGEVNPSGKLTVTIARNVGQIPAYYYHKPSARRGYVLSDITPLYPFGHGLSYTTFQYGEIQMVGGIRPTGRTTASIAVTNTGKMDGDEVVQLYIHQRVSSVTRPVKLLRGFERVHLKAGETKTVSFSISAPELYMYNEEMQQAVEPGMYDVMIGGSSEKTVSAKLEVIR